LICVYNRLAFQNPLKESSMKTIVVLVALALAAGSAFAADAEKKAPSAAQQAQQERMKSCNADAGKQELKGDERKKFMSACLGSKAAPAAAEAPVAAEAAAPATQQSKMKSCNAEAGTKALKGDERKAFMSDCLKADKK
jgi:hypothetical protein